MRFANPDFWRSEFEQFKTLLPHGKVLDIGCGGGRDALLFVPSRYNYVGIDFSREMLEQAQRSAPNAIFVQMDMYALNFVPYTFDGFWAAASLLHIPKTKTPLVLREIHRVTKTGGI